MLHKLNLRCPSNHRLSILEFSFDRDGNFHLECVCVNCGRNFSMDYTIGQLIVNAYQQDELQKLLGGAK